MKPERELKIEQRIDADTKHELHTHDLLEINVLLEGYARFKQADHDYSGRPGDVFFFRPGEPHYNLAEDRDTPITWIMVLFSPSIVRMIPGGQRLLYPFYTEAATPLLSRNSPYARSIQTAARGAYEEQQHKLPGWEAKQFMYFIDILSNIYRHTLAESAGPGNSSGAEVDSSVQLAVEYILQHIAEDIDMETIAELSGRGRTQLYTRFKRAVGVTPNQYINRLRMQMATDLLKTTDKSVTEIAFECGYNSLQYFNKHFKQYREMSPREFRNRSRQAI